MDSRIEEIVKGLQRLLKGVENSFIATVENDKTDTVDVRDLNGASYLDVRKIATSGKKGFVPMLPKGSYVIVSRISKSNDLFISMMTEIESITLDITNDTVINGGDNGGLVISEKMKAEFDEITKRCNDIVTSLTSLASAMTATAQAPVLGAALGSAITTAITSIISPLVSPPKTSYENDKIKH